MNVALHVFIAGVIAGLVHIFSLMAIPLTIREDAFSRLERLAGNGIRIIEPAEMRELPFADPALAIAVCPYDLTGGPFRVRVGLSETFLAVVFAEKGRGIFSSVSDRAATSGVLDAVLLMQAQLDRIASLDDRNEAVEEIRVLANRPRGIAILKVLVDRPSSREEAVEILRNARCETEELP